MDLPIEYFHTDSLFKLSQAIGRPIKMDIHTSELTRGRYARVCIEVNTEKPLPPFICINGMKQEVAYELHTCFCNKCGIIGHFPANCTTNNQESATPQEEARCRHTTTSEWRIIDKGKHMRFQKQRYMQGQRDQEGNQQKIEAMTKNTKDKEDMHHKKTQQFWRQKSSATERTSKHAKNPDRNNHYTSSNKFEALSRFDPAHSSEKGEEETIMTTQPFNEEACIHERRSDISKDTRHQENASGQKAPLQLEKYKNIPKEKINALSAQDFETPMQHDTCRELMLDEQNTLPMQNLFPPKTQLLQKSIEMSKTDDITHDEITVPTINLQSGYKTLTPSQNPSLQPSIQKNLTSQSPVHNPNNGVPKFISCSTSAEPSCNQQQFTQLDHFTHDRTAKPNHPDSNPTNTNQPHTQNTTAVSDHPFSPQLTSPDEPCPKAKQRLSESEGEGVHPGWNEDSPFPPGFEPTFHFSAQPAHTPTSSVYSSSSKPSTSPPHTRNTCRKEPPTLLQPERVCNSDFSHYSALFHQSPYGESTHSRSGARKRNAANRKRISVQSQDATTGASKRTTAHNEQLSIFKRRCNAGSRSFNSTSDEPNSDPTEHHEDTHVEL